MTKTRENADYPNREFLDLEGGSFDQTVRSTGKTTFNGSASFAGRVTADVKDDNPFAGYVRNDSNTGACFYARNFGIDGSASLNWKGLNRAGNITSEIFCRRQRRVCW